MYYYANDARFQFDTLPATEPTSSLEELLAEGTVSCSSIGSPTQLAEFDPCTWDSVDWTDVFCPQTWSSTSSPLQLSDESPPPPSPASDFVMGDTTESLSDWVSVPSEDSFHTATVGFPSPSIESHQFMLDVDFYGLVDRPRPESPPQIEPPAAIAQTQQHSLVRICNGSAKSEDVEEAAPQPAKRRRQDTTPRFQCDKCNSRFARSHNLKVHIKSVHENQRSFPCKVAGCEHAFSRKHDLTRHFQSKHTNKGSPRRKGNKE
ncbi:hypothetical protein C8Q73DRAFT_787187 [Cubamyces lactineus]|nr:hypothetical protein C8Q73DRAFT_787187 [Cubamyces lactineus]